MQKRHKITNLILCFVFTFLLNNCSDGKQDLSFSAHELHVLDFQGFQIPQFRTATAQLNYAKSGFASLAEKQAAFKILFELFPEAKIECGKAALNLAYMHLGRDYRFARVKDINNAANAFKAIIKTYEGHPVILAKAHWYLGWINCELLLKKQKGLEHFWHIVKTWPWIKTQISSPVPWVSLVYPLADKTDLQQAAPKKTHWAELALLEIIRHTLETGRYSSQSFNAFETLWENYQKSTATGLAIKLMLKNKAHDEKIMPYVKQYLSFNIANIYLEREIQNLVRKDYRL